MLIKKTNRLWQIVLDGVRPKSERPKKLNPLEKHFIHITSRRERFLSTNWRLGTVCGKHGSAKTVRIVSDVLGGWSILTFCPFQSNL